VSSFWIVTFIMRSTLTTGPKFRDHLCRHSTQKSHSQLRPTKLSHALTIKWSSAKDPATFGKQPGFRMVKIAHPHRATTNLL
ncbi:hypothetical protein, partial [uncultured Tateyamaria sp.]|uniref:hypothetical protein n=1 Tax=uncultured Tateyamaria sp. TaxID=455651 RepID=UPI0026104EE3